MFAHADVYIQFMTYTYMHMHQGAESAVVQEEVENDRADFVLVNFIRAPSLVGIKTRNLDWRGEFGVCVDRRASEHNCVNQICVKSSNNS